MSLDAGYFGPGSLGAPAGAQQRAMKPSADTMPSSSGASSAPRGLGAEWINANSDLELGMEFGGDGPSTGDTLGFDDLLDIVNPLQHIPIVNTVYRDLTGDQIDPWARVVGAGLYGGPLGVLMAGIDAAMMQETGRDLPTQLAHVISGGDPAPEAGFIGSRATPMDQVAEAAASAPGPVPPPHRSVVTPEAPTAGPTSDHAGPAGQTVSVAAHGAGTTIPAPTPAPAPQAAPPLADYDRSSRTRTLSDARNGGLASGSYTISPELMAQADALLKQAQLGSGVQLLADPGAAPAKGPTGTADTGNDKKDKDGDQGPDKQASEPAPPILAGKTTGDGPAIPGPEGGTKPDAESLAAGGAMPTSAIPVSSFMHSALDKYEQLMKARQAGKMAGKPSPGSIPPGG